MLADTGFQQKTDGFLRRILVSGVCSGGRMNCPIVHFGEADVMSRARNRDRQSFCREIERAPESDEDWIEDRESNDGLKDRACPL